MTQAERREATRTARLAATIACLVDELPQGEDRLPTLLDLLWDAHQGDLFVALSSLRTPEPGDR
ncbi:MAG: hypothetical protein JHC95_01665 [Solirubrobacteraceae bacterium]|nr:hypothetical protein [Solirubrobacteraceae bacterium]